MVSQIQPPTQPEVIYPDSDGQPVLIHHHSPLDLGCCSSEHEISCSKGFVVRYRFSLTII